nr:52 kDa repressor of the inhibitor of the protein kinase-like isoform X2 [Rhipicephalus microplus]
MPNYCAAHGCRSTYGRDDVAFHKFPRDKKMAAKWVAAFKRKGFKPTRASVLCSKHFRDSDYVRSPALTRSLGLMTRCARLNSDAVPSVFPHLRGPSPPPRPAFVKRRKLEMLAELLGSGNDKVERPGPSSSENSSPVAATLDDCPDDHPQEVQGVSISNPQTCDQCMQTDVKRTRNKSVRADVQPPTRYKGVQAGFQRTTCNKGVQTDIKKSRG